MWIKRDLSQAWSQPSLPVRVLQGLRQSGKTSFLERVCPGAAIARLDDLSERKLAQSDPALFFANHPGRPLILDEAQYAPNLFPEIKAQIDALRRERLRTGGAEIEPRFFISGSNQTILQADVGESLAGRASFYRLHTLSIREIRRSRPDHDLSEYYLRGGWPELQLDSRLAAREFLDDYIATFVEKDIARSAGVEKIRSFEAVLGLLAARTAQQLNLAEIAGQAGVDASTLRGWVSILEQNLIVSLLPPYHSNLSKRLVKSPKVYFLEPSLATRLQGWSQLEPLLRSPQAGALFETVVHGELVRTIDHGRRDARLYYLRTRDGDEVDFLVEGPDGRRLLIEAKLGMQSASPVVLSSELARVVSPGTPSWVVVAGGPERDLGGACQQLPVDRLADRLDEWLA